MLRQRPQDAARRERPLIRKPCPSARLPIFFAPVPAVLIGALVMKQSGVPSVLWIQNLAVAATMLAGTLTASRTLTIQRSSALSGVAAGIALAILGMTFIEDGLQGVNRWVTFGRFQVHAGAVFLPLLVVITGKLLREGRSTLASLICVSALGLISAQPDAASATAFGIASILLFAFNRPASWQMGILVLCVCFLLAWVWQRPDPLGRVTNVEDIVSVAAKQGWYWAVEAIVALAVVPLSFLLPSADQNTAIPRALACYFAITIAARLLGNFPVPFVGYGASPIIGYFLAVMWLADLGGSGALPFMRGKHPKAHLVLGSADTE